MKKLFLACVLLWILASVTAAAEETGSWLDVMLYFRFGDTACLGSESARIDLRQEETVATLIVRRLIEGPQASHEQLSNTFPRGTQLISAQVDGDTAYVTLSMDFLGKPDGAPSDWESRDSWQEEAVLRRRLAYQSIVLSLTEEGRCQRVQLYVAEDDDAVPQRVALRWFDSSQTDKDVRLAACGRDDSLVLTPKLALENVLQGCRNKNWDAVWPFIARTDREAPASLSVFRQKMEEISSFLLSWSVSSGNVSVNGSRATVVLDGTVRREDGGTEQLTRVSVPLFRENDNWVISMSALTELMNEEEP